MRMAPSHWLVSALGALVILIGSWAGAPPTRAVSPPPAGPAPLAPLRADEVAGGAAGDVFGFLPYWCVSDWTHGYLRYDLLTTIAFFGVPIGPGGHLTTSNAGYRAYVSERATRIIRHAHAAGVRTVITFTSFGLERNDRFLSSRHARARFVREAVKLMQRRGADGANLDVELLRASGFPAYGRLVAEFAGAAHTVNPAAQISVSTNAATSGARMAQIAIANGADRVFLMGYAYRWSRSLESGSVAPLVRSDGGLSLTKSVRIYAAAGVPANRTILGLPYYGMTWPTVDGSMHAARQPNAQRYGVGKVFLPSASAMLRRDGSRHDRDPVEHAKRVVWRDRHPRTWRQTYFDDGQSLRVKEQFAIDQGLGGMGIWALGYDRGLNDYWAAIEATFGGHPLGETGLRAAGR